MSIFLFSTFSADKRELLRDSLSEDESQPPPYTSQPRPSKVGD